MPHLLVGRPHARRRQVIIKRRDVPFYHAPFDGPIDSPEAHATVSEPAAGHEHYTLVLDVVTASKPGWLQVPLNVPMYLRDEDVVDLDQAEEYFTRLIEAEPAERDWPELRAHVRQQKQNAAGALADIDAVAAMLPDEKGRKLRKGWLARFQPSSDEDDLEDDADREADPDEDPDDVLLARLARRLKRSAGDPDEAERVIEEAPSPYVAAMLRTQLAMLLQSRGDPEAAQAMLARAIEDLPQEDPAIEDMMRANLAGLSHMLSQLDGDDAEALDLLGGIFSRGAPYQFADFADAGEQGDGFEEFDEDFEDDDDFDEEESAELGPREWDGEDDEDSDDDEADEDGEYGEEMDSEALQQAMEHVAAAQECEAEGDLDGAVEHHEALIELDPNDLYHRPKMACLLCRMGRFDEAWTYLDHAVEHSSFDPDTWFAVSQVALANEDVPLAEWAIDEAIAVADEQSHLLCFRALVRAAKGDAVGELADLNRAIELTDQEEDPDPNLYLNRASYYFRQKQGPQALADYNRALEIDSEFAMALRSRAALYSEAGRFAEALADIRRALKLEPGHSVGLNNLAWCLAVGPLEVRNPKEALKTAQKISRGKRPELASGSTYAVFKSTLAAAHGANEDYEKAVTLLDECLEFETDATYRATYEALRESFRAKKPYFHPPQIEL